MGSNREGKAWVGYLIMIILGIAGVIGGIVLLTNDDCRLKQGGFQLLVFGAGIFLIALIEWIAGGTSQAAIGLNAIRVEFGNVPWWAHLVGALIIVVMGVLMIFVKVC